MMNKNNAATQIYKSIDKTLNKLIESSAKNYLKDLRKHSWHKTALKGYKNLSKELLKLLKGQANKYAKTIEGKELFKKKIKKDEDEDDSDDIEDIIEDLIEYEEKYDNVVDDDIKGLIEELKEEMIEELEKLFEEEIEENLLIAAAKNISQDLGIKFNFNKFNEFTRDYLKDKKINWAKQVQETTEKRIKKILVQGFEEGLGSYDIAKIIYKDNTFSYNRAETIVRTEVISSCNYADNVIWNIDDNIIGKEWSSVGDGRSRLSHSSASGQKVPKDKPFIIGGYKLMHPGDTSLGAPASEIISCRCTMRPIFKGESLKSKIDNEK